MKSYGKLPKWFKTDCQSDVLLDMHAFSYMHTRITTIQVLDYPLVMMLNVIKTQPVLRLTLRREVDPNTRGE